MRQQWTTMDDNAAAMDDNRRQYGGNGRQCGGAGPALAAAHLGVGAPEALEEALRRVARGGHLAGDGARRRRRRGRRRLLQKQLPLDVVLVLPDLVAAGESVMQTRPHSMSHGQSIANGM